MTDINQVHESLLLKLDDPAAYQARVQQQQHQNNTTISDGQSQISNKGLCSTHGMLIPCQVRVCLELEELRRAWETVKNAQRNITRVAQDAFDKVTRLHRSAAVTHIRYRDLPRARRRCVPWHQCITRQCLKHICRASQRSSLCHRLSLMSSNDRLMGCTYVLSQITK